MKRGCSFSAREALEWVQHTERGLEGSVGLAETCERNSGCPCNSVQRKNMALSLTLSHLCGIGAPTSLCISDSDGLRNCKCVGIVTALLELD